ncbi:hypothetical protein [Bacillus cereus]|uniref:Uncharacterized protein n=1 Tax=Bacillus cereus VD184 TaxID=1053242 RepID=A0A9W5RCM9_BACCE|nr:hypothetical protein [Bacillus cereus]EOQ22595.1 hypothetical protein IKC_06359 [Bacillus cereus VD184]
MVHLQVINGIKKKQTDYYSIYNRMYIKCLEQGVQEGEGYNKDTLKKIIFTGVRMFNLLICKEHEYGMLMKLFQSADNMKYMMSLLTPKEFMNIFPIDKEYDGHTYQTKDYYSTIEQLSKMDMDKPIGDELDEFLWNYWNWKDIAEFQCNIVSLISAIRKVNGQKDLMEQFCEEYSIDMYTMGTNYQGKEVIVNHTTGEAQEVIRKRPRYLQPVRNEK